ncbi:hypothetical protein HDU76_008190 [Blyttiomyces sp. JEL0837]|nr:hypothetical protein HDU76_008190 [Blyttiomyces sp. JEL0837]
MASSSTTTGSASADVMAFLEDIDTLVTPSSTPGRSTSAIPSTSGSGSGGQHNATHTGSSKSHVSEEVLSFLDELTAPPTITKSPSRNPTTTTESAGATGNTQPAQHNMDELQSASVLFQGGAGGPTSPVRSAGGASSNAQRSRQQSQAREAEQQQSPVAPAPADDGGWSWNSIWSTAQATASKVSAATASSLKMAEAMVEETTKVVTAEKVKGLVADVSSNVSKKMSEVVGTVNTETMGKLSKDISAFTLNTVSTIGDVLAPPIRRGSSQGRRGGDLLFDANDSVLPPYANTITVWLCPRIGDPAAYTDESVEGQDHTKEDAVHDFVQASVNEMWLPARQSGPRICHRVIVNSVSDPAPRPARGLEEAVRSVEVTLKRLQKLAEANPPPPEETDHATLYLVVQPFTVLIASELFGARAHRQYLTVLLEPSSPKPGNTSSSSSAPQPSSTAKNSSSSSSLEGFHDEGMVARKIYEKWSEEQVSRVVENAITDLLQEFSLKVQMRL